VDKILPKLSNNDHRRTLTQKDLDFHMKREGNVTVFCVANTETSKRLVWGMIDEACSTAQQGAFKSKNMRDIMQKFNDPKNDKIAVLNEKIDDVKAQMIDNIDKVIERGQKLDQLAEQTNELSESAVKFKKTAKQLKNNLLARLVFLIMLLIFILIGLVVIAIFAGCGFPFFPRCGGLGLPGLGGNTSSLAMAAATVSQTIHHVFQVPIPGIKLPINHLHFEPQQLTLQKPPPQQKQQSPPPVAAAAADGKSK